MTAGGGVGQFQSLARVVALLFAGLSVVAAVGLWRLVQPVSKGAPAVGRPVTVKAPTGADVSLIVGRHLFGQAAPTRVARDEPQTRANLVLGGIWYADSEGSYALIGEPGGQQRSYRVGDRMPGDVELAQIHADRVVLRRAGQRETLHLPHKVLDSTAPTRPTAASPAPLLPRRSR